MKALKIIGWSFLIFTIIAFGILGYLYKTNPMLQAIVKNDESKLYYFPVKEMDDLNEFEYSEKVLHVEDSVRIYTYYFQPFTPEKKANVFFIHGAGGNVSKYRELIKPLLQEGFAVYAFDWRGYGNSTGVPGYRGVLKDTEVAFEHFISETGKEGFNTIVFGLSLGGQLAVKITKDNQRIVDALVLDGSIASAQEIAIDYAPISFLKERAQRSPADFNQEYVGVRDIAEIKNIPKLIIHSKNDKEVPFRHGKLLFDAAQEPKNIWITDTKHIMTLLQFPGQTVEKIQMLW